MTSAPISAPPSQVEAVEDYGCLQYFARQPILDRSQRLFGYEILFRSGHESSFHAEPEEATRSVLDSLLHSGLHEPASGQRLFVNCTRQAIVKRLATLLPAATTVIEVLETVEPDEEVLKACRELKHSGYEIALDDFVLSEQMRPFIELADYIKVDFRETNAAARQELLSALAGRRISLLAEKVESPQEFEEALCEGFEYFQGYFFCHPILQSQRQIPSSALGAFRLVSAISKSPFDLDEVTRIIESEAALSYRLLRLVNSAGYGMRTHVSSIHKALLLAGEEEFRKLASVAVVASMGQSRPGPLLVMSLERARFCELAAPYLGLEPSEQYLLGLLSLVDALLKTPMEAVTASLPLRAPAKAALLGERNAESLGLEILRGYEAQNMAQGRDRTMRGQLPDETLHRLYAEAVRWAHALLEGSRGQDAGSSGGRG